MEQSNDRQARFLDLSRVLLEIDDLSAVAAEIYLSMLDDRDPEWPLDDLAATLVPFGSLPPDERERRIITELRDRPAWHDAAVALLQVWYSGSVTRADHSAVTQPPGAYIEALCWQLLRTRAPGLPGPFFGEWAYPPTRADDPLAVPVRSPVVGR